MRRRWLRQLLRCLIQPTTSQLLLLLLLQPLPEGTTWVRIAAARLCQVEPSPRSGRGNLVRAPWEYRSIVNREYKGMSSACIVGLYSLEASLPRLSQPIYCVRPPRPPSSSFSSSPAALLLRLPHRRATAVITTPHWRGTRRCRVGIGHHRAAPTVPPRSAVPRRSHCLHARSLDTSSATTATRPATRADVLVHPRDGFDLCLR